MAGTLTPTPYQTVLDTDGVAVSGALIYTYVGGTTTAATTYADASLATPNTNPIVADSAGRFVAYLPAGGNFKFLYKTAAGATIEEQDNILSVPGAAVNLDIEGTVGEAVTAGQVCYLSTGAEVAPLTAGLWYLTDADAAATSTTCQSIGVAVSAIAINTAGTIRLAGTATMATAVVIGSTYYVSATAGAITATPPALSRTVGVALTTSTLLLAATTAVVTPGGSNTQVQFNDSGVLGGDSGFTFIKATDAVAIVGPLTVGGTLGVTGVTTLTGGLNTPLVPAQGGTGLSSYAVGDLVYASGATTLAKLADVAVGQVLVSGGVATAPAYSASPSITALTYTTNLKSTTALATPAALTATQATAFASTVSGAAIMGFGTTNDVSLMNRAGTVVLGIGPNTTTVNMTGLLTVSGFGTHSFSAGGTGEQVLSVQNTTSGTGNYGYLKVGGGTNNSGGVIGWSQGFTTSTWQVADSLAIYAPAAGGLSIAATNASGAIRFYSGGTSLRGGFESTSGNFHIGPTASTSHPLYVEKSTVNHLAMFYNTNGSSPHGVRMYYTAAAPNGTANDFFSGYDTVGLKFEVRSNGGIGNYSGNNVNLSDRRIKNLTGPVESLRAMFGGIQLYRGQYKESSRQTDDIMWVAQEIAVLNPDWSEVFQPAQQMPDGSNREELLGTRDNQIFMANVAVTIEHEKEIIKLAARIAALETKDN
jgi:hypothetical protein